MWENKTIQYIITYYSIHLPTWSSISIICLSIISPLSMNHLCAYQMIIFQLFIYHLLSFFCPFTYQSSTPINLHLFTIYMSLNHPGTYPFLPPTLIFIHLSYINSSMSVHPYIYTLIHASLITCLFIYHLSIDLSIISSFTCHLFINPFVPYSFLTHLPSHPSHIYYISIFLSSVIYQLFIH